MKILEQFYGFPSGYFSEMEPFYGMFSINPPNSGWQFNPVNDRRNALAFLDATNITDPRIVFAIDYLVVSLKNALLWQHARCVYPLVGGTSFTAKYNLVDTDTYALTFYNGSGAVTISNNGVIGSGTAYYDTGFNPNSRIPLNSISTFVYLLTDNTAANAGDIGNRDATNRILLNVRNALNQFAIGLNSTTSAIVSNSLNSKGMFGSSRINSANVLCVFPNRIVTTANTSSGIPSLNIYGLAYNNAGTSAGHTLRQQAFAWIGTGMDWHDCVNLRAIVNNFQLILGRNIQ